MITISYCTCYHIDSVNPVHELGGTLGCRGSLPGILRGKNGVGLNFWARLSVKSNLEQS